jgi:hypothetical protein
MPVKKPKRKPAPPVAEIKPRPAGHPLYAPSDKDRVTVRIMVAGGIEQEHIATVIGISGKTLRKHFRPEIDRAAHEINALVVGEHIKKIRAGDFRAIQWWEQSRMNWTEKLIIGETNGPTDLSSLSDADLEARIVKLRRNTAVVRALPRVTWSVGSCLPQPRTPHPSHQGS